MNKAVVFDNTGTLLNASISIKDLATGNLTMGYSSEVAEKLKKSAIIYIQVSGDNFIKYDENLRVFDLFNGGIDFDINISPMEISKQEVLNIVKNDSVTLKDIKDCIRHLNSYLGHIDIYSGITIILNLENQKIEYTSVVGGPLFDGVIECISNLQTMGVKVFVASGDSKPALIKLAHLINVDEKNIFANCKDYDKANLVSNLKDLGYNVTMVGDGHNDVKAFMESDFAILINNENNKMLVNYVDRVVSNVSEILKIV